MTGKRIADDIPPGVKLRHTFEGHTGKINRIAWSPDGEQFAFVVFRQEKTNIFVANADGSEPRQLTNYPGYDFDPQWSPDGEWIVFESSRDGNLDIYIVAADYIETDDNPPRRLTTHEAMDMRPIWRPSP